MIFVVLEGAKGKEWLSMCDSHWPDAEEALQSDGTPYEAVTIPASYVLQFSCEVCAAKEGSPVTSFVADA